MAGTTSIEGQIDDLRDDIADLRSDISELRTDINNLQEELQNLELSVSTISSLVENEILTREEQVYSLNSKQMRFNNQVCLANINR